jgi:hypothetical protein
MRMASSCLRQKALQCAADQKTRRRRQISASSAKRATCLILCEAEGRMVDLGNLNAIIKRPNCHLCSLIALGCKQIWRGSPWGDESTGTTTKCYISKLDVSKQQTRGYALQISEFHADRPFQWVEFEIIFKGHDASLELADSPFKAFPTVDFAFLKSALRNCEEKHDSCKAEASNTPEDMSVIDLENMSIVYAPKTADILL